jgi:hypothetical protein
MIYPQTTFPFELCDLSSEPPEGDSSIEDAGSFKFRLQLFWCADPEV